MRAAILFSALALAGCASLQVQATPESVNATYVRIGDQDLAGLKVHRSESGAVEIELMRQKATGEDLSGALRATMGALN